MRRDLSRRQIASRINVAAHAYSQNLVGRQFLYVFDNRYIEVLFKGENFRHLTGVETDLPAKAFFRYAKRGILSASQISFNASHPYALCVRKIEHILNISNFAVSECFILEDITTQTATYKFGTTDLNFSLCFGREFSHDGSEGRLFVPQSLRDEDCFSKSQNVFSVTHIFRKRNDVNLYSDLLYHEKSSVLPEEILPLISTNLRWLNRDDGGHPGG